MTPLDPQADAVTARRVLSGEDAYDAQGGPGKAPLDVAPDAWFSGDWSVRGHIVGQEALFPKKAAVSLTSRQVWYGWLAQSVKDATQYLAVIRGTDGLVEWGDDARFLQTRHPKAGNVEAGFFSVYQSFQYHRPGGLNMPLAAAISATVGTGHLLVAGHSLGAALATYLAVDLADPSRLGNRVALRAFASPRPGDGLFTQYASAALADCRGYAREFDMVPRVPFGLSYSSLPTTEIAHDAFGIRVRFESWLRGNHHLTSYLAQIDPDSISGLPSIDSKYLSCLILPTKVAA